MWYREKVMKALIHSKSQEKEEILSYCIAVHKFFIVIRIASFSLNKIYYFFLLILGWEMFLTGFMRLNKQLLFVIHKYCRPLIALFCLDTSHVVYVSHLVCSTVWTDSCKTSHQEVFQHLMQARSNAEFIEGPTQAVLLEGWVKTF